MENTVVYILCQVITLHTEFLGLGMEIFSKVFLIAMKGGWVPWFDHFRRGTFYGIAIEYPGLGLCIY